MPHSTTRDGVRIYFEEHGRGEPVLLAYGIGGNTGMWEPNIDALSAHHRLILWEPRGHARSDSPQDPRQVTFTHWTWDLYDLLDHLRIERGIVGGLSLGGGIATRFTLAHPGRVRALLIIDSSSASGLPLGVDNIVMRAKSIEVTLAGGMDAMAEFAIASNPNVSGRIKLDPSARKEIFDYYRMLTPIGYANALRALLQMDYITDRLGEITVPISGRSPRPPSSSAVTRIPRSAPCGRSRSGFPTPASPCSRRPATSPTAISRRPSTAR